MPDGLPVLTTDEEIYRLAPAFVIATVDKLARMARAIVAVGVGVEQVRGKAKMSQNRHPDDIRSLADEFERQGEARMADFLRTVSLPYAEERFATLARLRGLRTIGRDVADFH